TKSSSTSLNSLLEETNTFHNSLPEFENFYFDLGEISSGSTTTHSNISLSEYDSFIFDPTHEEFAYELAHVISPSEYDRFYFWNLPDPGCAILREKLKEDLVSYFQNFQNTSESSDDSTNVVNAPREPFVVKQDHGVNPPHIDKCCCECGEALDGIFCQQCICKSCGKEISSGSPTTQSDISLSEYDSFIFDLTHKEFADELTHIISPPEYDCFYFWNLPDLGELMSIINSEIRKNPSTTRVNLLVEDDYSPHLAYVEWIFLAYLTYPVIPPYLHPFGNEDTIFDPGITINHIYSFKPGLSHRYGAFKKFNTHRSHLNEWPMIINGKNILILDVPLFHFYPP
nr:hypothetical protein [Tanacetum cinerariifolium]